MILPGFHDQNSEAWIATLFLTYKATIKFIFYIEHYVVAVEKSFVLYKWYLNSFVFIFLFDIPFLTLKTEWLVQIISRHLSLLK